ncbi:hypothetical protein E2320_016298 [Naja naja]|nr:hypothetical protein E2320_016298 [Naja naja]
MPTLNYAHSSEGNCRPVIRNSNISRIFFDKACKMKFLKNEYLVCGPKNADCPKEASTQTTACDRVLRACIYRFGEGLDCPGHLKASRP